uniref:Metalloendopeptidase n=1 Tax=Parastrongyloides trichosuri TaxID=131310 RepID=A0A0N4Z8J5_PARTI
MFLKAFFIIIVLTICTGVVPKYKVSYNNNFRNRGNIKQEVSQTNNLKWSSPIEYHISVPSYTDAIDKVIKFLRQKTCLMFSKLSKPVDDRAVLDFDTSHNNNKAFLGKVNDSHRQKISLNESCYSRFGCILKYTLITLGLTPPILREDRNQYVKINLNNTSDKYKPYFDNTPKESYINISSFPYDYSSITHPDQYYYTKKGNPTIEVIDANYSYMIGQEDAPSFQDMKILNWYYCKHECLRYTNTCRNGGYQNPYDCTKCVCPTGFGGKNCEGIRRTYQYIELERFVYGKYGAQILSGNEQWAYRFKTYNDSKIKIVITKLEINKNLPCTEYRGLQVKYEIDKTKTGIILCNRKNVSSSNPLNITSEDNSIIVLTNLRDRFDEVTFSAEKVLITNEKTTKAISTTFETLNKEHASHTTTKGKRKRFENVTTGTGEKTTSLDKKRT